MAARVVKRCDENAATFMKLDINVVGHVKLSFPIVVPANSSIEAVSQLTEAEIRFKIADKYAGTPWVISIYDTGYVPLRFASPVSELVDSGDTLNVLCILTSLDLHADRVATMYKQLIELQTQTDPKCIDAVSQPEAKCLALLHNIVANKSFQEYCLKHYEIENLLFWLDVEVFRSQVRKAFLAGNPEGDWEDFDDVIHASNPLFSTVLLHAQYICFTYLCQQSTLALNLPERLLRPIGLPISRGPAEQLKMVDTALFDELQSHVFYYLAHVVYPNYTSSTEYQTYLESVTNQEFLQSWITPGAHCLYYPQEADAIVTAVNQAFEKGWKMFSTVVPGSERSMTSLSQILATPTSPFKPRRLSVAQRSRRIQRERKLRKFFGDRLDEEDPMYEAQLGAFSKATQSVKDQFITDSRSKISQETLEDDTGDEERKRRAVKLSTFFGTPKLPQDVLLDQNIISHICVVSTQSDDSDVVRAAPAPVTRNDLSPTTKRLLTRRSKKLKEILGEPIDEEVAKALNVSRARLSTAALTSTTSLERAMTEHHVDQRRPSFSPTLTGGSTVTSLTSVTSHIRRNRESKEYQRKKLAKIQQFLGERISLRMLDDAKLEPMNKDIPVIIDPKQRVIVKRRLEKLQGMFGEVLPLSALQSQATQESLAPSDTSSETRNALQPLATVLGIPTTSLLQLCFTKDEDISEFIQTMEAFEEESGCDEIDEEDAEELAEQELEKDLQASRDLLNENANQLIQDTQRMRQRKRIGKLTKFFGSTAGQVSANLVVDDRVVDLFVRYFDGVMDPAAMRDWLTKSRRQHK